MSSHRTIKQQRLELVKEVLTLYGGNKTRAAKALGVSIRSLRNWVREEASLSEFRMEASHPYKKEENHIEKST